MRVLLLVPPQDLGSGDAMASMLKGAGLEVLELDAGATLPGTDLDTFDAAVLATRDATEQRRQRCAELRRRGYLGGVVVMTTAAREGPALLDAGADELVLAPGDLEELLLRITAAAERASKRTLSRVGPFEIDRLHRAIRIRGAPLALTAREYALLACLLGAAGRPVTRSTLLFEVWGRDALAGSNLVEVHLSRLRDKLGADAAWIETVRGTGYRVRV